MQRSSANYWLCLWFGVDLIWDGPTILAIIIIINE